jgi:hypothetical protein
MVQAEQNLKETISRINLTDLIDVFPILLTA